MDNLFEHIISYNNNAYRNVVEVTPNLDELVDNSLDAEAINLVLSMVGDSRTVDPLTEFYYTTSIGYPFETDHFSTSRFSDGTYPVWYGSTETETTVYETAYHMLQDESSIIDNEEYHIIYRDRVIYSTHCEAILVDLCGKEEEYPDLVSNDYSHTQQIGKKLQSQGHPGLLSRSARCEGKNINIFKKRVLSQPKVITQLHYMIDLKKKVVQVEGDSQLERIIEF